MVSSIFFRRIFFLGVFITGFCGYAEVKEGANLLSDALFAQPEELPESFVRLRNAGPNHGMVLEKERKKCGEYTIVTYPVTGLKPGKMYRLSAMIKTDDISSEFTECCNLEFYHQKRIMVNQQLLLSKGSTNWHLQTRDFMIGNVPFDTVCVRFFLEKSATGKVFFCQPSLREIMPDAELQKREYAKLDGVKLPASVRPKLEAMRENYLQRMSRSMLDMAGSREQFSLVEWRALCRLFSSANDFETTRKTMTLRPGVEDVIMGYASGAEKVLPQAAQFRALPETVKISAAQNEHESFQVVVFPAGKDLTDVSVRISELKGPDGAVMRNAFTIMPVGFVKVKTFADYVGYYPDPLMTHLTSVERIRAGSAQPFWCRLAVPPGQTPGMYHGDGTVLIGGAPAFRFHLEAKVYNFSLPNRSMLPLAITFLLQQKHRDLWNNMLQDYYITPDNLYWLQFRTEFPGYFVTNPELLSQMKDKGTLNRFNLGYLDEATADPQKNHGMKYHIERIRPRYQWAKEMGLLKYAYIYGCDESHNAKLTNLAATIVKKEFPEVPFMTTANNRSGELTSWDWYCGSIVRYEAYREMRKKGKQVWWYICCNPSAPYPNIFVDSPAIDIRLLMGAMTAKYRPDGFLYYEITRWQPRDPKPLGKELYTAWEPNTLGDVNGDGYWFYLGPDRIPLPSLRVENFRDGLEDYAYYEILRRKVEETRNGVGNVEWRQEAEAALKVPESLVKSLTEFNRNPAELYRYRERLATLIESAPKVK